MQPPNRLVRVGAILFVLWGVLHVVVGVACTISYVNGGPLGLLAHFGWSADPHDAVAGPNLRLASHIALDFSIVLVGYGVQAIWAAGVAWRGHALGVWLNAILLGIADREILRA